MPNGGKQACEGHEEAKKHIIIQKGVSYEDKCRFGSSFPSSIGLKYGRLTDLCMNTLASVQRCKEAKKAKRVAQRKPKGWRKESMASISTLHGVEKGVNQAHRHHKGVSHK